MQELRTVTHVPQIGYAPGQHERPLLFTEMPMHLPKPGHEELTGAVDYLVAGRNSDPGSFAQPFDLSITDQHCLMSKGIACPGVKYSSVFDGNAGNRSFRQPRRQI